MKHKMIDVAVGLLLICVMVAGDGFMLSIADKPGTGYVDDTFMNWMAYIGSWGIGILINCWGLVLVYMSFTGHLWIKGKTPGK